MCKIRGQSYLTCLEVYYSFQMKLIWSAYCAVSINGSLQLYLWEVLHCHGNSLEVQHFCLVCLTWLVSHVIANSSSPKEVPTEHTSITDDIRDTTRTMTEWAEACQCSSLTLGLLAWVNSVVDQKVVWAFLLLMATPPSLNGGTFKGIVTHNSKLMCILVAIETLKQQRLSWK